MTTAFARYEVNKPFEGVIRNLERRYRETESEWSREEIGRYMTATPCGVCHGARLRPEALAVKIDGLDIGEVTVLLGARGATPGSRRSGEKLDAEAARDRRAHPQGDSRTAVVPDRRRARLSDAWRAPPARCRAARASASASPRRSAPGLTGVLYVLDEPSIGLHQRDNARLLDTLRRLRDLGNSVIVVEHDEDAILAADYVVDVGPGAGIHGGEIVVAGNGRRDHGRSAFADRAISHRRARGVGSAPAPQAQSGAQARYRRRAAATI